MSLLLRARTRVAEHLRALLVGALQNPDTPLSRMLAPAKGRRAGNAGCLHGPVVDSSQTAPRAAWVASKRRSRRTPNAVALTFADTQTHLRASSIRRARQLAARLRALGAKRGKRIGICLERSPEMVIAVLAVLKTGAAYVPLDPTYPPARLRIMLGDADPVVLVTTEKISASLPPYAAQPLFVEQQTNQTDTYEAANINPDDIAYVIYTSGSTGTPKGVLVTHGNVANHLAWRHSFFPLQSIRPMPADGLPELRRLGVGNSRAAERRSQSRSHAPPVRIRQHLSRRADGGSADHRGVFRSVAAANDYRGP